MSALLRAIVLIILAVSVAAGQSSALSGSWRLNVDKSTWGTRPKPVSVTLLIEHKDPQLSYSGVVIYTGEDARPFAFSGAVDGKAYPMDRSFASGTVTMRRIDSLTIESVFRSEDGNFTETTRTSVTANGKTLTRRIKLQSSGAVSSSVEVYDRQ
jgi:hypothetical protein